MAFAIVWIYNHGVLKRGVTLAVRSSISFFRDGRLRIVFFYVFLILAYGGIEAVARSTQNYFVYDLVKVLIATSAFLHYYYDGFIWKVHKKSNENLVDDEMGDEDVDDSANRGIANWLSKIRSCRSGLAYLFETGKQVVYFGVPIVFLAWTDTTYSLSDVEAKEYLTRLTPNVAKSHDDPGVAYSRKGLFDKGIASHQKAIAADSSFAQAYTHMGIAHSLKGNRQKAVELHLKAIKIDPEVAQAHFLICVSITFICDELTKPLNLSNELYR